MLKFTNRTRRARQRKAATRALMPRFEAFESRLLLASGFLQGTVYAANTGTNVDNGGTFDPTQGSTPIPNATVDLYQGTNTSVTPYATTTSASNGAYSFTGLSSGTYTLVEIPPSSYANAGTQVNSPLDPVTTTTSSSITVQVEDLSNLTVTYNAPYIYSSLDPGIVTYEASPDGGTTYDAEDSSLSQIPITVTYPGGTTTELASFCVDVFSDLNYGVDTINASGQPLSTTLIPSANANAIGYLYNQYSTFLNEQFGNSISNSSTAATNPLTLEQGYEAQAMQLAIWKLLYDTGANLQTFSSGNIQDVAIDPAYTNYPGVADDPSLADLESRAITYINDALNNSSAQAIELLATSGSNGFQDLLAPETLNFSDIPKATPGITTTPSQTSITLGSASPTLKDTAFLTGGGSPTGSIVFTLYAPNGTTVLDSETVPVSGDGSYSTPTGYTLPTTGTVTGTYQWDATYSGDGNNLAASDNNDAAEQVTVSAAGPAITTTPGGTVVLGSGATLTDTAILSGGYNLTGSLTFTLYAPNDTTVVTTETVTVNGAATYQTPTGYVPTGAGTYEWGVSYSGDANNNGVSSPPAAEQETVSAASPAITTTPGGTVVLGSGATLTDTAILSGGYNLTGSLTFTLYAPNDTTVVTTETVTVNGAATYHTPTGYVPTGAGTYEWGVSYSGDANNNGVSSPPAAEQETVSAASPAITTTPGGTVVLGSGATLTDTAILSGGYNLTGSLTFTLYAPNGTTVVTTETVTVNGAATYHTPTGYVPTGAGTYEWGVSYSGDANNNGVSSPPAAEQETVSAASPAITTTPGGTVVLGSGATLTDTAILSGGYNLTGSLTFTLYAPNGTTVVTTETVTVNGAATYHTPTGYVPTGAGTYEWGVSYSGDANNNGVSSPPAAEQETVSAAGPTFTTTPSPTVVPLGTATTLKDTATLTGGYAETGTITFTLYQGSTKLDTETATVNGNGTYTTPTGYGLSSSAPSGVYQWDATYSGDANNKPYTDNNDVAEQVTVVNPCCNVQGVSYSVYAPGTTTNPTVYSSLGGHTQQGDSVSVTFTVPSGEYDQLSLVSYTAPESYFVPDDANLQVVYQSVTQVFGPGTHTLGPITLPNSFYQVDFVCGTVITTLGLNSSDFYSAQSRLLDSDNGGTNPVGSAELQVMGTVFFDVNDDGIQESGDQPISGATVTLTGTDAYGNAYSVAITTNGQGQYSFAGMPFSNSAGYTVTVTVPSGDYAGIATAGKVNGVAEGSATTSPEAVSSIVMGNSGRTSGTGYNFGIQQPVSIKGEVYVDANGNGQLGGGDSGINGVTVTLYNSSGVKVTSTTTSGSGSSAGSYSFTNLAPGTYSLVDTVLGGYLGTGSDVGTVGGIADGSSVSATKLGSIVLGSGQAGSSYNFGIAQPVSISGLVYNDTNGDGHCDNGEKGLSGVTITLYNSNGTAVATTTTNSSGNYSFTNLAPGTYTLVETVLNGYKATGSNVGNDGGSSWSSSEIGSISLTSGESGTGYNFGLKKS